RLITKSYFEPAACLESWNQEREDRMLNAAIRPSRLHIRLSQGRSIPDDSLGKIPDFSLHKWPANLNRIIYASSSSLLYNRYTVFKTGCLFSAPRRLCSDFGVP